MTSVRQIAESPMEQGTAEIISYRFNTTKAQNNGTATPSSATITVFDVTDGAYTDVTSTVMPTNSPTIATVYITLSPLKLLTVGHTYRVEILFVVSGNTLEHYHVVYCER